MKKINTAIFISGRGSNLESLIKFSQRKNCSFKIAAVISNNNKAKGLNIAKKNNIKITLVGKVTKNLQIVNDSNKPLNIHREYDHFM